MVVELRLAPDQVQLVAVLIAVKLLEVPLQIAAGPFTVIVGVAVTVTVLSADAEQPLVVPVTV